MPHFQSELATDTAAAFTERALQRSTVYRTTLAVIVDENGAVSAWIVPEASPRDRAAWLESFGINPNALWPSTYYAYGYYNADGKLVLDGNDEGLKDLVVDAFKTYALEGEELFPMQRKS